MELKKQKGMDLFLSLDNLLEILGNPTRRIILSKLAKVPLGASELASSFGKKISRQAIHSQLKMLADYGIIGSYGDDPRNIKYRIKSNLSLRINITPDYYNINYNISKVGDYRENLELRNTGCHIDYQKIKTTNQKFRFIGEKIKEIEQKTSVLETKRNALLHDKECFIIEVKNLMTEQYDENLKTKEQPNLEKEIFYTLFSNPAKYFKIRLKLLWRKTIYSEHFIRPDNLIFNQIPTP